MANRKIPEWYAEVLIPVKNELSVNNGILLRGNRLIIPSSLHLEIIEKLHSGHQGFTKCQQQAKDSVWWPGIKKDIEEKVSNVLLALSAGSTMWNHCCHHHFQIDHGRK